MFSALIIDNDPERAENTRTVLEFLGHAPQVHAPASGAYAADQLDGVDVIVLAPVAADNGLLETFRAIKSGQPHLPVIAMMAEGTVNAWDQEIDAGSVSWIPVPLRHSALQDALQLVKVYRENRHLNGEARSPELFRNLSGTSPKVRRVRKLIEQVAQTDATVLLTGESGTGKEVVARKIHYHSPRRYKPFVPVNCGAIPGELLESELFGHEKGAFTGAISTRRGRFEMAAGGTLFLDEIGDMSMTMQVKLLRVLQERTFERVGSNESRIADVRIVAATHSDLEQAIRDSRFREDLFYRLNVFPIEVPPLRERSEDLPLLVKDLVQRLVAQKQASVNLSADALLLLQGYQWPGNVRELANLIERLVILYPDGIVEAEKLPAKYRLALDSRLPETDPADSNERAVRPTAPALPPEGLDLKSHLNALERGFIEQALSDAGGVVSHAAKRLQMGRTTLVEKMRKHGIRRPQGQD
jgi:sigma-54 specific flagellar transcriptional regulator A